MAIIKTHTPETAEGEVKEILDTVQGMTEEDIEKMVADPSLAPLEDKDRALLSFVTEAIKDPDAVGQEDMDHLRDLGWADSDILEAMAHGANMVASGILMKTFKMDVAC
jgi:alkylhydroperoxidase family enzyme